MDKLELKNVTFAYKDIPALVDFTHTFEMGKTYCIEGPNGCGKSTLFRILAGLSFPQKGSYHFLGEEMTEKYLSREENAFHFHETLGYLFQNSDVQLFTSSVEDEIMFGVSQLDMDVTAARERVDRYIEMFGLENLRGRAPFTLSGGEKKRTVLATVLAMEPKVLLLDEPLSGLDEEGQMWITQFLQKLKGPDKLIIIATHNKELVSSVADEVVHMDKSHHIV